MKKIKWENIVLITMILLWSVPTIVDRISGNPLNMYMGLELIIHIAMVGTFYYVIKDIRTNPSNWN